MASVPLAAVAPAAEDWPLSHPWTWLLTALTAAGLAWGLSRAAPDAQGACLALVLLGLAAAGVGVWVGFGAAAGTSRALPRGLETYLAGVLGLGTLALGGWFGLRLLVELGDLSQDFLRRYGQQEEGPAGPALASWVAADLFCNLLVVAAGVVLTATFAAAAFRRAGWTARDRGTALLAATWLTVLMASLAVEEVEWDSIALFLRVASLAVLAAAALYALPGKWRRAGVSGLILLHFGGICTAALSAPPDPWLVTQIWTRFYRPYLEFMYLNNAYRYYSPEPGPPSMLWFRLEYLVDGRVESNWLYVPDMDTENGRHRHPLSLVYQRRLSLTQNAEPSSTPLLSPGVFGLERAKKALEDRLLASNEFTGSALPLGKSPPKLVVPFYPKQEMRVELQFQVPNFYSRDLIRSYALHALTRPHPRYPDVPARSVKVYRVVHQIMSPRAYAAGLHATNMVMYHPFYMGEFDRTGQMTEAAQRDPFLYWLLPNLQDDRNHPDNIRCYYLRHAGDHNWVLWPDKTWRPE